jgi:hypothetical protein
MSNRKKRRELSGVAADVVVDVVVMANRVVDTATVSKEGVVVVEQDPRQPWCMLKNLSSRVKTMSKCTQHQPEPKLKSRSKSRVTSKLPRTTTLRCERTLALKFDLQ